MPRKSGLFHSHQPENKFSVLYLKVRLNGLDILAKLARALDEEAEEARADVSGQTPRHLRAQGREWGNYLQFLVLRQ